MGKFPLTEIKSFVSRYFCNLGGGGKKRKEEKLREWRDKFRRVFE